MSNRPNKPIDAHQLQRRLYESLRDTLNALEKQMREHHLPNDFVEVRNRAREVLRRVPEQGEP